MVHMNMFQLTGGAGASGVGGQNITVLGAQGKDGENRSTGGGGSGTSHSSNQGGIMTSGAGSARHIILRRLRTVEE